MFGANLRVLCQDAASISALCRDLGINRTQFNRYLGGESFPRPDVLHRICTYFNVDARILLEPVGSLSHPDDDLFSHAAVREFLGMAPRGVPHGTFPSGMYRFTRPGFMDPGSYVVGLIYAFRSGERTFVRGYEPRSAMRMQGLPTAGPAREFRGIVLQQDSGVSLLIARRGAVTFSFNYLSRIASYQNNFWVGYATRTASESLSANRISRMVYEHLGDNRAEVMRTARMAGYVQEEDLLPFHRQLLMVGTPFR